ncbi:hypothetical protein H5T87_05555 [bacterium]|nr:hypothetical protein [bacterium]
MRKVLHLFSVVFLVFIPLLAQKSSPPEIVIVAAILPEGEDVGIAFSRLIPHNQVEAYIQRLASLGNRNVENLQIRDEEGKTSAHFLLKGGNRWSEDRPYVQLFINSFPDINSLFIVLFPLRKIENSLPLHFENEDIIIRNLGMRKFNYEVRHKKEMTSPISLYSTWERTRFPLFSFAVLVVSVLAILLGRRRKKR